MQYQPERKSCKNSNCSQANPQPIANFWDKPKSRVCRSCHSKRSLEWRRRNPERTRTNARNWKRNVEIPRRYGLASGEYEARAISQNGLCAICEKPGNKRRLAVDHCHATGKIRGLLCSNCNLMLGNAKDSVALLKNAVKYLEGT